MARLVERFWDKVNKDGPLMPGMDTPCWIWMGSFRGKGKYGQIHDEGKNLSAHRLAYQFQIGEIPPGLFVCHRCDNVECVRGTHLFPGTTQENTEDRQRKNRQARGEKCIPRNLARGDEHWAKRTPEKYAKGTDHHSAKITDAMVIEILRRSAAGETRSKLSREFGIARCNVRRIIEGKGWTHVDRSEFEASVARVWNPSVGRWI